jgi:hypothetical protein
MKSDLFISLLLALFFAASLSGVCAGEEQETALTVEGIGFHRDKGDRERIVLECNQSCMPTLSTIEGKNLQMIMEVTGVSESRTNAHDVKIWGKSISRLRSYFDSKTRIFRLTIEMNPSKYYNVYPIQDPSDNTYTLMISEGKPRGSEHAKGSSLSPEKRITILRSGLRREATRQQETGGISEKQKAVKVVRDLQSLDQGRAQLNNGEVSAKVDTVAPIPLAHPQDSPIERLRRSAYDNLANGRRARAVEDWIQAARLGDTTVQSYLDFLRVKWREDPTP